METIKRIYTLLLHGNGLKVREIAKELELDAFHVADILFSSDCIQYWYQNDSSLWFAKEGALKVEEPEKEDSLTHNVIIPQNINKERLLSNECDYSIKVYLEEISNYRIYSEDEIKALFSRYRSGDALAYDLLVKSHLKLVANIARLYKSKGVHLCDLIQEGNIGLLKAIEKFDHTTNNRFVEFAKAWILQGISSSVANLPNVVRLPSNQIYLHRKIQKFKARYEQEHEYRPSINEMEFNSDGDTLYYIYNLPEKLLDMTILTEDWENHVDFCSKQADHCLIQESYSYDVNNLLRFLNKRDASILRSYFGIDTVMEETLNTIGDKHNLTRERARQIVLSSIKKLQEIIGIKEKDESDE